MGNGMVDTAPVVALRIFITAIVCIYDNRILKMLRGNQIFFNLITILLDEVSGDINDFLRITVSPDNLQQLRVTHFFCELGKQCDI